MPGLNLFLLVDLNVYIPALHSSVESHGQIDFLWVYLIGFFYLFLAPLSGLRENHMLVFLDDFKLHSLGYLSL